MSLFTSAKKQSFMISEIIQIVKEMFKIANKKKHLNKSINQKLTLLKAIATMYKSFFPQ